MVIGRFDLQFFASVVLPMLCQGEAGLTRGRKLSLEVASVNPIAQEPIGQNCSATLAKMPGMMVGLNLH